MWTLCYFQIFFKLLKNYSTNYSLNLAVLAIYVNSYNSAEILLLASLEWQQQTEKEKIRFGLPCITDCSK